MSIAWLTPIGLLGLALVALPIAIHLLVQQKSRQVPFPSLRFLQQSRLAALRRRTIRDAALLACRIAIVMAAALALAGPLVQSPARTAVYSNRTVRAVVVEDQSRIDEPSGEPTVAGRLRRDAYRFETFTRANIKDGIADAVRWLEAQPPARRELVVVSPFRRGQVSVADLAQVPESVGITLNQLPVASEDHDVEIVALTRRGEALARRQQLMRLDDDQTRIVKGGIQATRGDAVSIVASAEHQTLADAALRAALGAGVAWSTEPKNVLIVWAGADEAAVQRLSAGATVIRTEVPDPPSSAASAISDAIRRFVAPSLDQHEPVRLSPDQLAEWSRPPGGPPSQGAPHDEGDRRWLWGMALLLMALEYWLRSGRNAGATETQTEESRVA